MGQRLHIVSGAGLIQIEGQPVRQVGPGDTVWFDPNLRHWHGAAPDQPMSHIAVQRHDETGNSTHWREKVEDADYHGTRG